MLKIHKPYKVLIAIGTLFVSGALLFSYCSRVLGFGESSETYAAEDFSKEYRTISDITYMQEMNQQICSNTPTPNGSETLTVATLIDKRGGTGSDTYRVAKLGDGNCWMLENLRLPSGTKLESSDSDVSAYTVPANKAVGNTINNWDTAKTAQNMAEGHTGMRVASGGSWKPAYGNYYSWCTATAGTCTDSGDAPSSICPKGWRLPSNDDTNIGTYTLLNTAYSGSWESNVSLITNGTSTSGYTGRRFGYNSADAFFPAAGTVYGDGLAYAGSSGAYWSRTGYLRSPDYAYSLLFSSSEVYPADSNSNRDSGFSVRCVAAGGLEPNEAPAIPPSSKDGSITVNVTPTITLDVSDGVTATAEADKIATGTIEATVTSNSDYDVLLSAKEPRLISKENSNNYIPVVSTSNPVQPGNDAWGILNKSGLYDPITTTPSPFYSTLTTSNNSKTHKFTVGISISPSLPADTYATEVTVTAATK